MRGRTHLIDSNAHTRQQVRRRYAEYRADREANAYDNGRSKLLAAFNAEKPYKSLCSLLAGKWSSSVAGWTIADGWLVQITSEGSVTYKNEDDGIDVCCGKMEWLQVSGMGKPSALCITHAGSKWRLQFRKSQDDYLSWNLFRVLKNDRVFEESNIVYERIK